MHKRGFLSDAAFNFLGLLGWSLDDHTEIIDRDTFVRRFSLDRVLVNPAVFDHDKLKWMNGMYIRKLHEQDLAERIVPFLEKELGAPVDPELLRPVIPLIRERIKLLSDAVEMAKFFFVEGGLDYETETLLVKKLAGAPAVAAAALQAVIQRISGLESWQHEALEGAIRPQAEELGIKTGELFGLIRVAVTGRTAAPPLFETMAVLGRERSLERLESALRRLQAQSPA